MTLAPLLNASFWAVRVGDFPRLQIAVVCLGLITAILALRTFSLTDLGIIIVLALCTIYQVYRIYPYTPIAPNEVEESNIKDTSSNIRILISNVLISNRNANKLLQRVEEENPDIILLAEVDTWWADAAEKLKEEYPFTLLRPLENGYGMTFYSRLELRNPRLRYHVENDIPSVETEIKLANGRYVKFYGLHPRPPVPGESLTSKTRDAELLIVAKEIKDSKQPTIVAGDFNDVAWSETTSLFQKISGLLDSRVGRGLYSSFHADYFFLRFPLDHVFQSNHFRLNEIKRLESIDSDHFPVFISLSLERAAKFTQEEPEPDETDEKEADRKIDEGLKE